MKNSVAQAPQTILACHNNTNQDVEGVKYNSATALFCQNNNDKNIQITNLLCRLFDIIAWVQHRIRRVCH